MILKFGITGAGRFVIEVFDFESASGAYRKAIEDAGVGGRNCTEGRIYDHLGGKVVARVSYNGRVWSPKKWAPGDKPLFDTDGGAT